MSNNPYLSGTEDDDLLSDGSTSATSLEGGDITATNLPAELKKALHSYIGAFLPGIIDGANSPSKLPIAHKSIAGMYDFFSDFSNFRQDGPLILALAEVLDEMTDGRLRLVYDLHECERQILYTHAIQRVMRRISANPPKVFEEYSDEIGLYYEVFNDIISFTQDKAITYYYDLCEKIGREPDTRLVEDGIFSVRDAFARAALGRPPADAETQ